MMHSPDTSKKRKIFAIFCGCFLISCSLFIVSSLFLVDLKDNIILLPIIALCVMAISFLVFQLGRYFVIYVKDEESVINNANSFISYKKEATKSHSLFFETLQYIVGSILLLTLFLLLYWTKQYFTLWMHLSLIALGNILLLFLLLRDDGAHDLLNERIKEAFPLFLIILISSIICLVAYSKYNSYFFLNFSEIISWIIPLSNYGTKAQKFILSKKSKKIYWKTSIFSSIYIIWQFSTAIIKREKRNVITNQAFAISIILLIFVVPDYAVKILPSEITNFFIELFNMFGDSLSKITKEHVSYIALLLYTMNACYDPISHIPDIRNTNNIFSNLYDIILKVSIWFSIFIFIICIYVFLFIIGNTILGSDMMIIFSFFTFPIWIQRIASLFVAAMVMSCGANDDANYTDAKL